MGVGKTVLVSLVLVEDEPAWVVPREADEPAASPAELSHETREAEAPEIRRLRKHLLSAKSVAGGGFIIVGLVSAIFAAVFAYIRVTRKRDGVKH
ncbi:hypothetical protein CRYUN_Cryun10bG0077400 [Craigia yunnanensis]